MVSRYLWSILMEKVHLIKTFVLLKIWISEVCLLLKAGFWCAFERNKFNMMDVEWKDEPGRIMNMTWCIPTWIWLYLHLVPEILLSLAATVECWHILLNEKLKDQILRRCNAH